MKPRQQRTFSPIRIPSICAPASCRTDSRLCPALLHMYASWSIFAQVSSVLMETINHLEKYEMSHSNEKGKQNSYPLFAGWAGLHGGKTCCKCVLSWSIHFYGPSVLMDIPVIMYADHPIEALTCQNLVLFHSNIEYHKRVKLITIKACHVFLCYPASLQKVTCI